MSNLLWKSFNLCLSKFKCLPTITFSPPPTATNTDQDHQSNTTAAAAANPLPLFKNFNSLYDVNYSDIDISTSKSLASSTTTTAAAATEDFFSSSYEDSDTDSVPDFTSAFASHRFFFSSPGSSNSIFEPLEPLPPKDSGALVTGGVAVHTYSPDPYSDFRKSMLEMIEARHLTDVNADWEFLHELLLCYLTLNPKHTHKFIVGAFSDIIVSLLTAAPPTDPCRKTHIERHCSTPRLSV
ncbi:Transcription repressor OFP16 [Sesamum alatum]|uniref:Transcription repressor n=1 Tax=Sesamum alatum TaxID=300844 RepID=A0AAE1Y9T3_9LAMI|nr:Transcription repressor OFP16 [Sesamum alatum]